jgi:hypothetical protein
LILGRRERSARAAFMPTAKQYRAEFHDINDMSRPVASAAE